MRPVRKRVKLLTRFHRLQRLQPERRWAHRTIVIAELLLRHGVTPVLRHYHQIEDVLDRAEKGDHDV